MDLEPKNKLFEFQMLKQLKSNYSLYPLVFVGFLGISLASFQIVRTLIRSPDCIVNRRKNPHPWEKLLTDDGKYIQYKYFSTKDYKILAESNERPKIF